MSQKYKNQSELHIKKMMSMIFGILALFLCVSVIALFSLNAKKEQQDIMISSGKFDSIKAILEYFGCKYKKETESDIEGFKTDIYTVFKYDLYDGEEKNEKFYNNVINKIAEFLNYSNFRLIDTSREEKIDIQVICKNGKVSKIIINGIEDYFIYMDSQISLRKYKEIKTTEISVQAPELIECIQKNWSKDCNFGTREAIFQGYYMYFDEGIEVRSIDSRIYNVVFTEKYEKEVVNGFTVGTKSDIIKERLGVPTFQNSDGSIIGYKSNELYVFFTNDQISIYRNTPESGYDEFFKLVDQFLEDKYSLLEFMNELTYIWPDYEEYTYGSDEVYLSYPNKGIDIKLNYDNTDGIVFYNNIGVKQEVVNKYLEHTEFVALLQVDNIYNAEIKRVSNKNKLNQKCDEYKQEFEKEDQRNRGQIYNYYMNLDSSDKIMNAYFIPMNPQFVNCELNDLIDTYIWLNEYCFIYSNTGKGIYYYDLKNQVKGIILQGDENFKIKSYENGVLKYDDKQISIVY